MIDKEKLMKTISKNDAEKTSWNIRERKKIKRTTKKWVENKNA